MDDQPNTQAAPVQAIALIVPTNWTNYSDGSERLTGVRGPVTVIDFYREDKTP